MKGIHVFKSGKHTDSSGQNAEFTESTLKATAAAYNPKTHEAPIVIGHPKSNGPAWGWVSSLTFSEDGLVAEPAQIDPTFEELVEAGRYKKVSASFYQPDSPNNPVPGVFYLRHVGFLGAQPPAIKGLKDIAFNEDEEGVIEFSASVDELTSASRVMLSVFRKFREFLIDKFSREEADEVISSWALEDLEQLSRDTPLDTPQHNATIPSFEENPKPNNSPSSEDNGMTEEELKAEKTKLDAQKAANEAKETAFSERETQIKATEKALSIKAISADLDALVKSGKVLPAQQAALAEFMSTLDDTKDVVALAFEEGGAGDGKKKKSQRAFMQSYLNTLPKIVEFQEVSGDQGGDDAGVDESNSQELAGKALAFQESEAKKGRTISITQAVNAVVSGKTD